MRQKLGLAAVATLVMAGAAWPAATALVPEPVRVIAFSGVSTLPILAGQARGVFARRGLAVEVEITPNSQFLRSSLAAGKFEVAHAAVDNAVAMVEAGGSDIVIVMGGDDSLNELIVQPEVPTTSALRGRTVIVDAPDTAYALQLRQVLLSSGLAAGRDYAVKPVGGTPQRLQAMLDSREHAASMLNPPSSILAKRAGLRSLGLATDLLGAYQGMGAFTQRAWARDHRDTLVRYLAACVESLRWLLALENKREAIGFIAASLKLAPDVAEETYARAVASRGGLARDARLDVDGLRKVLKLRAEAEGQWNGKPPPPERYYDPAYYDAALALLAGATAGASAPAVKPD